MKIESMKFNCKYLDIYPYDNKITNKIVTYYIHKYKIINSIESFFIKKVNRYEI